MNTFLYILLIGLLASISFEDFKDRKISVFLLLAIGLLGAYLHYQEASLVDFTQHIVLNITGVLLVLLLLALYTRFRLSSSLFSVFGLGDAVFFIVMALSLPTFLFAFLFVMSLVFALAMSYVFIKRISPQSIPLAGLQALFFLLVFTVKLVSLYLPLNFYTV